MVGGAREGMAVGLDWEGGLPAGLNNGSATIANETAG